jgi:hypothetical protein
MIENLPEEMSGPRNILSATFLVLEQIMNESGQAEAETGSG